jgi:UDP-GlcNAc:undecaprenyl-phosphate/decaprenyl-phosphate GlcNAc-1-phosphate transferase
MSPSIFTLASVPLAALAIAAALIPMSRAIGIKLGITAPRNGAPEENVAAFGGAAIVGAILFTLALFGELPHWLAFSVAALWLIGAIDDARDLRPYQKLVGQIIVAVAMALALPRFHFTPWFGLDLAIEVFWLVATSNAFNLIDGIDGLAAGTGIVAALTLAATGVLHHNSALMLEGLAVAGALGGFLLSNFPPASIFMGDSGALAVGMLLGAMALEGGALATNSRVTKYVFPILVMLTPLLDTAIVSATRFATQNPISRHGADHSHHRLLALGLSERMTDAVCWSVALSGAGLAIVALILPHAYLIAILPLIAVAVAMIALFMIDLTFESVSPALVHRHVQGAARFILSFSYKRRIAEAIIDSTLITAAYFAAYLLRHNFRIQDWEAQELITSMPAVWIASYGAFALAGIYRGIWRYTGLSDGIRFASGAVLSGIFLMALSMVMPVRMSGSILVLFVILLFNLLVVTRSSFQSIRSGLMRLATAGERVLVIGGGQTGTSALSLLSSDPARQLRVVGLLDDEARTGHMVQGHRVLGQIADLAEVYRTSPFERILIASDRLTPSSISTIRGFSTSHGIAVHRFTIRMDEVGAAPAVAKIEPSLAALLARPGTNQAS